MDRFAFFAAMPFLTATTTTTTRRTCESDSESGEDIFTGVCSFSVSAREQYGEEGGEDDEDEDETRDDATDATVFHRRTQFDEYDLPAGSEQTQDAVREWLGKKRELAKHTKLRMKSTTVVMSVKLLC